MDNQWTRLGDLCENSCNKIRNFTLELDHNKNESIVLALLRQNKIKRNGCIIIREKYHVRKT